MIWYWILLLSAVSLGAFLHVVGVVNFNTTLPWSAWVILGLVLFNGGFMAYDGGRALIVGDYITPQKGEMAGQLGPWASLVESVGIEPRSSLMKVVFFAYGLVYIIAAVAFVLGQSGAYWAILTIAVLGLWYLPFGTLINIIVILLLWLTPLRP